MAKAALLVTLMVLVALCVQHEAEAQVECSVPNDCVQTCNGCQQDNKCIHGFCLCGCHGELKCSVPGDCGDMCGKCSKGCLNGVCICQC